MRRLHQFESAVRIRTEGAKVFQLPLRFPAFGDIKDKPSRACVAAGLFESLATCLASNVVTQQIERSSWNWPRPRGFEFADSASRRVCAFVARTSIRSLSLPIIFRLGSCRNCEFLSRFRAGAGGKMRSAARTGVSGSPARAGSRNRISWFCQPPMTEDRRPLSCGNPVKSGN